MRKLLIAAVVLSFLPAVAHATAQVPDIVTYEGKKRPLLTNPLESYFKKEDERPNFHTSPGVRVTSNWRGYVAMWEVVDDTLYLVGLDSWICKDLRPENCKRADLKELFGEKYVDGKVKADWFTGELRLPDGKQLQYVHMGYGSVYERDIVLSVAAGKVTGKEVIDNTRREPGSPPEPEKTKPQGMARAKAISGRASGAR
jgi:hypothetical protein